MVKEARAYARRRSLNDVVGPAQQRLRDRQAERLGCLEVDHQLELGRLLDRQFGRFCALQDFIDENRGPLEGNPRLAKFRDKLYVISNRPGGSFIVVRLIENILCWLVSANGPRTRSERKFVRPLIS